MNNLNTMPSSQHRPTLERSGINRIIQLSVAVVVMTVILFVSAGRLDWTEAWIFLGVYVLSILAVGTWLFRHDVGLLNERGKVGENTKGWDKIIVTANSLLHLILLAVCGLDAGRFHWSAMPPALQIVGLVAFLPAMALPFWAMSVNTYIATVVRIQEDRGHRVITTGPYRYVRHPMYVGTILFALCTPLFFGSWWALLPGILAAATYVIRTALEDRTLQTELPGYAAYAAQVHYRLLPGLW